MNLCQNRLLRAAIFLHPIRVCFPFVVRERRSQIIDGASLMTGFVPTGAILPADVLVGADDAPSPVPALLCLVSIAIKLLLGAKKAAEAVGASSWVWNKMKSLVRSWYLGGWTDPIESCLPLQGMKGKLFYPPRTVVATHGLQLTLPRPSKSNFSYHWLNLI